MSFLAPRDFSAPNPVLLEIARFRAEEALSGPPQVTKTMLARQRLGPEGGARECALLPTQGWRGLDGWQLQVSCYD